MLQKLNRDALDYYLRGNAGELMRREAEQELYERGRKSTSEQEMVDELKRRGYVVFKPQGKGRKA